MIDDSQAKRLPQYSRRSLEELARYYEEEELFQEWREHQQEHCSNNASVAPSEKRRKPVTNFFHLAKQYFKEVSIAALVGITFFVGQYSSKTSQASYLAEIEKNDSLITVIEQMTRKNHLLGQRNASLQSVLQAGSMVEAYDSLSQALTDVRSENESLRAIEIGWNRQRESLLRGERYVAEKPPAVIDSLIIPSDGYFIEINKEQQRLRVWQPVHYALVADVPCSTGLLPGEKSRSGDLKTPSGLAMIVSRDNSEGWTYEGEPAYGPLFFRLNQGSWDSKGHYNPQGACSIGIHGTSEPEFLGEPRSHGCIRLWNEFVVEADKKGYLRPGTPVYIVPENQLALAKSSHGLGQNRIRNIYGNSLEADKKNALVNKEE